MHIELTLDKLILTITLEIDCSSGGFSPLIISFSHLISIYKHSHYMHDLALEESNKY